MKWFLEQQHKDILSTFPGPLLQTVSRDLMNTRGVAELPTSDSTTYWQNPESLIQDETSLCSSTTSSNSLNSVPESRGLESVDWRRRDLYIIEMGAFILFQILR